MREWKECACMIEAEDVRESNVQILDGKMPKTGKKKKINMLQVSSQ